jgi:arsenic resistance protein ArsH
MSRDMPNVDLADLPPVDPAPLVAPGDPGHPPRLLILHGSLRERSYSRALGDEAERLLTHLGAQVRRYDPAGLPLPDGTGEDHPKVRELREAAIWSEGMLWSSPERHGAMSAVLKAQIDWIPLSTGGVRPTQGKTLALAQVCGGSQSFNAVNQMRVLGRWMRMVTIPNQSSVPRAWDEFDEDLRMRSSPLYRRVVDVCEELVRFTWMVRGRAGPLLDRYSERVESAAKTSARVNQPKL